MAGVTTAVIAGSSAIAQTVNGIKQSKDAKNAIRNFKRQDLTNPFEDIQISTEKSEQQTEANLINTATAVEALRRGGTRAVLGGIPRINKNNILLQNLISADIDRQDKERSVRIARGEERIQNIRERMETRALQGLGQQLQTARQDTVSGIGSLISARLAFDSIQTVNAGQSTPSVETTTTTGTGSGSALFDSSGFNSFNLGSDNASLFDEFNTSLA